MENINVKGKIRFAGRTREDEKDVVILNISDETRSNLEKVFEGDYVGTPLKVMDDGEIVLKASSKYPVKIYDNDIETEELSLSDLGRGTEVTVFVGIGESVYKRKTYLVAYLKGVNVLEFVEKESFNPFTAGNVKEY